MSENQQPSMFNIVATSQGDAVAPLDAYEPVAVDSLTTANSRTMSSRFDAGQSDRPTVNSEFEVEAIMAKRLKPTSRGTILEYLVKWRNYDMDDATWEPESNIYGCEHLIQDFEQLSKHCAQVTRKSDAVPRYRGSALKYAVRSRSSAPSRPEYTSYMAGESDKGNRQEQSSSFASYQQDGSGVEFRPRRRGRPRGRGRSFSIRKRYDDDDKDFVLRSSSTGRRRRRAGRRGSSSYSAKLRGRYSRLCYPGTYSTMEEFKQAEEEEAKYRTSYKSRQKRNNRRLNENNVSELVDLIRDDRSNVWVIAKYEDERSGYITYKSAREKMPLLLIDLLEKKLVVKSADSKSDSEEEQVATVEATVPDALEETVQPPVSDQEVTAVVDEVQTSQTDDVDEKQTVQQEEEEEGKVKEAA